MKPQLQIKNGRVSVKVLAKVIGLKSGYQAIQRKASKLGVLHGYKPRIDPGYILHKDLQRIISSYSNSIIDDRGKEWYEGLMDAAKFTDQPKKDKKVETEPEEKPKPGPQFKFLSNTKILFRLAATAMLIQSCVMLSFLLKSYDINYGINEINFLTYIKIGLLLLEAICFQATVLFLATRKGKWGVFWITTFAIYDCLTNGFVVGFLDANSLQKVMQFIAMLPLPLMIGAFVTLFKNQISQQ